MSWLAAGWLAACWVPPSGAFCRSTESSEVVGVRIVDDWKVIAEAKEDDGSFGRGIVGGIAGVTGVVSMADGIASGVVSGELEA